MYNLEIRIDIKRLSRYSVHLEKEIGKKKMTKVIEGFSYYIRNLYLRMIREAIYSNRYKGDWEPVDDEGYLEYLRVAPAGNILEVIEDALEVKKLGSKFVIRINPEYYYPGSRIRLIKVLRAIDSGTSKFSARPIFSKIIRKITNHIDDLWRGYLLMKRGS